MVDKARELALKTLYKIDKEQAYSNIALNDEIKQNRTKLNEKDIGLISEITYGVTTWKLTIDEIIKKYSKIKLKKISPWIINILRMGTYQIIFLDKIPKSAAVNESVNLAKRYGHSSSSNFVNAILRKVEKNDYEELYKIENDVERISKTTSMPEWIVEELIENYGKCKTEEICKNSNLKSKIAIRVNTLKTTENELIKVLEEKKIISNQMKQEINDKLIYINNHLKENIYINIVYFIKDKNKNGGIYVNKLDYVKKIDNYKHELILNNNERILFDDIYSLEYEN